MSVDLLMFLFFNTTTKTNKAEEIFNRYSDSNKVSVRGEIEIDGEDYIIVRELERKKAKSGEWNVKTELDFFKKLADGQLQNFTGEQRRETESFIKNSIGDMDDFLMTILTTASNLEDLIEAKPTARGQVLTKFLGLEALKEKEETSGRGDETRRRGPNRVCASTNQTLGKCVRIRNIEAKSKNKKTVFQLCLDRRRCR